VGIILGLAGLACAVTLDGLSQNNGRLALVVHRLMVGCVHLVGVVATTVQLHDLVIGHVLHQLKQLRVFAEEMLASVGTAVGLVVLQLTVADFIHAFGQQTSGVAFKQRIPVTTPQDLDHVPACALEYAFKLLHDLAVAAYRAVQTLQVAVDHEYQVFQLLAPCQ